MESRRIFSKFNEKVPIHILIKVSAFVDEFYLLLVKRPKLPDPGFSQLGGLGFSSSESRKYRWQKKVRIDI